MIKTEIRINKKMRVMEIMHKLMIINLYVYDISVLFLR
jgi:hypothetical protein